eukprot:1470108-Amphidinium_carterae.1
MFRIVFREALAQASLILIPESEISLSCDAHLTEADPGCEIAPPSHQLWSTRPRPDTARSTFMSVEFSAT